MDQRGVWLDARRLPQRGAEGSFDICTECRGEVHFVAKGAKGEVREVAKLSDSIPFPHRPEEIQEDDVPLHERTQCIVDFHERFQRRNEEMARKP